MASPTLGPTTVRVEFDGVKELLPLALERLNPKQSKGWDRIKDKFSILTPVAALLFSAVAWFYGYQLNGRAQEQYYLSQWPALQVRTHAEQLFLARGNEASLLTKGERLIRVLVTVENVGSAKTKLDLSGGPLIVAKVLSLKEGMQLDQPKKFWLTRPALDSGPPYAVTRTADEMRPKASDQFEFLAHVNGPGLYALMFSVPVDKHEDLRMKELARQNHEEQRQDIPKWDDIIFFEVK